MRKSIHDIWLKCIFHQFFCSLDQVAVLMHDNTLKRTTDVSEVFPGRENDIVFYFNSTELSQLNAGTWFYEVFITLLRFDS